MELDIRFGTRIEISELESFAREQGLAMVFTKLAEAREYRESAGMRLARGSGPTTMAVRPLDRLAVGSALSSLAAPGNGYDAA
jgi:hypothetical protein